MRGAIAFNRKLEGMKLTKKYQKIKEGEKIKYCYLKMPNPLHENVISVLHNLPREFDLGLYIDYNLQFEKAFLHPMRSILNVIEWKEEPRNSIEDFFI